MLLETRLRDKLTSRFTPERLEIINESHLHAGHMGSPGTGESHFRVVIVSSQFAGKNRLARHRMVNETVADEFGDGVHALAIKAMAPDEPVT